MPAPLETTSLDLGENEIQEFVTGVLDGQSRRPTGRQPLPFGGFLSPKGQIPLRYLVADLQRAVRTCMRPDSVTEFGFNLDALAQCKLSRRPLFHMLA